MLKRLQSDYIQSILLVSFRTGYNGEDNESSTFFLYNKDVNELDL